jgi:hypothetical protein
VLPLETVTVLEQLIGSNLARIGRVGVGLEVRAYVNDSNKD